MSTMTDQTVSSPRWMLWTSWLLSFLVVAQMLSSAFFRATQHTYAVAETARAAIPLVVAILAWGGLYLRDSRIRQLLPFRRSA